MFFVQVLKSEICAVFVHKTADGGKDFRTYIEKSSLKSRTECTGTRFLVNILFLVVELGKNSCSGGDVG